MRYDDRKSSVDAGKKELKVILPALTERLSRDEAGRYRLDWLAPTA